MYIWLIYYNPWESEKDTRYLRGIRVVDKFLHMEPSDISEVREVGIDLEDEDLYYTRWYLHSLIFGCIGLFLTQYSWTFFMFMIWYWSSYYEEVSESIDHLYNVGETKSNDTIREYDLMLELEYKYRVNLKKEIEGEEVDWNKTEPISMQQQIMMLLSPDSEYPNYTNLDLIESQKSYLNYEINYSSEPYNPFLEDFKDMEWIEPEAIREVNHQFYDRFGIIVIRDLDFIADYYSGFYDYYNFHNNLVVINKLEVINIKNLEKFLKSENSIYINENIYFTKSINKNKLKKEDKQKILNYIFRNQIWFDSADVLNYYNNNNKINKMLLKNKQNCKFYYLNNESLDNSWFHYNELIKNKYKKK